MKVKLVGGVIVLWALCVGKISAQNAAQAADHVLVAYFSWSGNTRTVAGYVKELTGGDLFEIATVKPYPTEYRQCTEYAKKEQQADARPVLKGKVADMSSYDVIFVGFPNWWGMAPMAVWTFLDSYDWTGKTVIPFCTHGGGGEQKCFSDFRRHIGKAKTKKGFICNGGTVGSVRPQVEAWLKETGVR